MRDLPSVEAQLNVINEWLVKFGKRRPSEAAMEVTTMTARHRIKLFRNLRDVGCIRNDGGWKAVADVPATAADVEMRNVEGQ